MSDCSCIYSECDDDERGIFEGGEKALDTDSTCSNCYGKIPAGVVHMVDSFYACKCSDMDECDLNPSFDGCDKLQTSEPDEVFHTCKGCMDLYKAFFCGGGRIVNGIVSGIVAHFDTEGTDPCCFDGLTPEALEVLDRAVLPRLPGYRSWGADMIRCERQRQVDEEGWSVEHDAREHSDGDLARNAAYYAYPDANLVNQDHLKIGSAFLRPAITFGYKQNKPRIKQLVIAGALIAAEIDRLQYEEHMAELERRRQWLADRAAASAVVPAEEAGR